MKKTTLVTVIAVVLIIIVGLVIGMRLTSDRQIAASVTSFDDCSKAGYPILETYPEQCKTPDGRTFTRLIGVPAVSTTTASTTPPRGVGTSTSTATSTLSTDILITSPKAGEVITSPVVIKGKARGSWFFEADFPVEIHAVSVSDPDLSPLLGKGIAQAQGEWMTNDFVPFTITITFERPPTGVKDGFIVFMNNNPSGLPENDKEVHVPVKFGSAAGTGGAASGACYIGGCSSEICSDKKGIVSNCMYRPEFACYKESFARCERQSSGQCGWTQTPGLTACISGAVSTQ